MNLLLSKSLNCFSLATKPTNLLSKVIENGLISLIPIRTKKVKTGGNTYNRRRTTPGKHRRLYVQDSEWVETDHLLVRQMGLQFYPGQNVIFTENRSLKARVSGHVIISLEKVCPYPDSKLYPYVSAGNLVERKFISVIPPERKGNYKLVDLI